MISIRPAEPRDAETLLSLLDGLADFEKLPRPEAAARERLRRDGFGEKRRFEAYLAEIDGRAVGYALIFETYSSFLALPVLYLEDLFVLPEARGKGAGRALFEFCLREATRRGCGRMEWVALDWNKVALAFYESYGAQHLKPYCRFRLTQEQLHDLERRLQLSS